MSRTICCCHQGGIVCPGFPGACPSLLVEGHNHMATATAGNDVQNDLLLPPLAHSRGFLSPRVSSNHFTLGNWFLQNQSQIARAKLPFYYETDTFSDEP